MLLEQVIFVIQKNSKNKYYDSYQFQNNNLIKLAKINKKIAQDLNILISNVSQEEIDLLEKIRENCVYLSQMTKTFCGLPYQSMIKKSGEYPVIGGKEISSYSLKGYKGYFSSKSFENFEEKIKIYKQPKIVTQDIVAHIKKPKDHIKIMSYLDNEGLIPVNTINCTISKNNKYPLKLILAILNSRFASWYAYRFIFNKAIRTMHFYEYFIGKIIIPKKIDNNIALGIIKLVEKMLSLNKRLNELGDKKTDERAKIEEEIKKTDSEIDELVYKIYGITDEEKKIIEESLK